LGDEKLSYRSAHYQKLYPVDPGRLRFLAYGMGGLQMIGNRLLVNPILALVLFIAQAAHGQWVRCDLGFGENDSLVPTVKSFASMGDILFANTESKVYRSMDNGITWTGSDAQSGRFPQLVAVGTDLFIPLGDDLNVSHDSGATWNIQENMRPFNHEIYSIARWGKSGNQVGRRTVGWRGHHLAIRG
jgi:hypothetical protein